MLLRRPRRNRKNHIIRSGIAETILLKEHLIQPLFILDPKFPKKQEEISSMPGIFRYKQDLLHQEVDSCLKAGIYNFILFPVVHPSRKNPLASYSIQEDNFYLKSIFLLKQSFPEIHLITDIALDPYNSDGHDGILSKKEVLNDETNIILAKMALLHAQSGADTLGPSDMMDGRILKIRESLEQQNLHNVSILAYSVKYASSFYGPFRDALNSAPNLGEDKKTYQMSFSNSKEALLEAKLDMKEGADLIMIKPGLPYLDIIQKISKSLPLPIVAYQVSGEYSMLKAAAMQQWLDFDQVLIESLIAMRRAGASMIVSYASKYLAENKLI